MLKRSRSAPASGQAPELSVARVLIDRADRARDQGRRRDAAALYQEALRIEPDNGPIHVQAGHMFKEAGDLRQAEEHYMHAARLMPDDADLALQLGHFYKVAGRLHEAERAYRRALKLNPGWLEPTRELEALARLQIEMDPELEPGSTVQALARSGAYDLLVPELMPRPRAELLVRNGESIHLRRLGRKERSSRWGVQTTLRGVEAIRGFCISADPIVEMQVLLNGEVIHRGPTRTYPLTNELENLDLRKCVFNVWLDFARFTPGRYLIELRFRDLNDTPDTEGGRRSHREYVVIDRPLPEPRFEGGGAWTPPTDPDDPRSVDDQINARPSLVSQARRSVFKTPIRNILVLRTDQLGDVVASIPALRRLRELFPQARIVGLLTAANADLARSLGLLDEIIVVDFPDDAVVQRKRLMTPENQEALRQKLAGYGFDVALDLAPAVQSRPLLLLSGAPFLAGMQDGQWPYLTAGFDMNSYDPVGRADIVPTSAKILGFVEALGAMLNTPVEIVRRPELGRERLARFGLGEQDRYVVLHAGARIVFSRWAHYGELAERLLAATGHKVVMLSDDAAIRASLPDGLLADPRFTLIDERLEFDDLDALLSHCMLFVGNDSGPKHLAALRGANVVSLHAARANWGEWGQVQTGVIIHRQVPCGACHIYHEPDECGRDYVCMARISLDEVWTAMQPYL